MIYNEFIQGVASYISGFRTNPYFEGTGSYHAWRSGWHYARNNKMKEL